LSNQAGWSQGPTFHGDLMSLVLLLLTKQADDVNVLRRRRHMYTSVVSCWRDVML